MKCRGGDILFADVATTATSMLRVDGVRDSLVRALAEAGVAELTPVQAGVLPHCLAGQDVLAKAKTGTGKTLAFLVPTVERLLCRAAAETGVDPVRALVISSARELGTQIATQAAKLTASQSFTIETIMGGSSITPQRERLDPSLLVRSSCVYTGGVDLMIATPGRLIEHINTTDGFSARLASCEVLVLDECDQLLDGGFQQDIEAIVAVLPAARQTLCFSATVPNKMLAVLGLAMRADFVTIDCVGEAPPSLIAQTVVVHPLERSLLALFACIRREMRMHPSSYKILAFLPTARQAQFCAAALQEVGCNALEIHSRRTASERSAASETFREQAQQVLLSSDVSARGVDYPDVSLVLQVGAPASRDVYVQRIGRTGRAGRAGASTLLLCEYETGFLSQLEGLPIAEAGCGAADAAAEFVSAREAAALQEAAAKVPEQVAAQTYRAWVVAMNGQRKALKWSKADLVSHASRYAREVLGRATPPALPERTARECGLVGQAGLRIDESPPAAEVAAAAEAEAEAVAAAVAAPSLELVIRFDWPAFCRALRKDAAAAKAAVLALRPDEAMELQARLETEGEAEVGGYTLRRGMFSASMVATPPRANKGLSRNSSAASLAGKMPHVASATSIASSSEMSAPSSQMSSRAGSALDLPAIDAAEGGVGADAPAAPAAGTAYTPPTKKKATKEELKLATSRMAAAGVALKEALAAGEGVKEAQAELVAAKVAKAVLVSGKF